MLDLSSYLTVEQSAVPAHTLRSKTFTAVSDFISFPSLLSTIAPPIPSEVALEDTLLVRTGTSAQANTKYKYESQLIRARGSNLLLRGGTLPVVRERTPSPACLPPLLTSLILFELGATNVLVQAKSH